MLPNVAFKLCTKRELNIGYFGGSITDGTGASSELTSWRSLSTNWFKNRYPDAQINWKNAAIGGTGSDFGAFRCSKDLLAFHPDLVFVEFAVNDGSRDINLISRSMEGIVRQILKFNPFTDIVFVYTMNKQFAMLSLDNGTVINSIAASQKIAEYYGIAQINVGQTQLDLISSGKETWETLTTDGTHPKDNGYAIYFDEIKSFLEKQLRATSGKPLERILPKPLNEYPLEKACLVPSWESDYSGWDKEYDTTLKTNLITCSRPGTTLCYEFDGRLFGISWVFDKDSGEVSISVDGKQTCMQSAFDSYALSFKRICYFLLDDLDDGHHKIDISILPEHDPDSVGTWVRISNFLIA